MKKLRQEMERRTSGRDNNTYVWNTGDGADVILDTDGLGSIVVDGVTLGAGTSAGDGRTYRWTDANGREHGYVCLNGARCVVLFGRSKDEAVNDEAFVMQRKAS